MSKKQIKEKEKEILGCLDLLMKESRHLPEGVILQLKDSIRDLVEEVMVMCEDE